MTTVTKLVTKKGRSIETPYSNTEALQRLAVLTQDGTLKGDFPRDLLDKSDRGLTPDQMTWVHILVVEAEAPKPEPVDENFATLIELFDRAAEKLAYPKVQFPVDGQRVKLARAGKMSKREGAINITDGGPFGANRWYGRIDRDGTFVPGRALTEEILETLREFAAEPEEFVANRGQRSGNCVFCYKELTTDESIAVGYGPVCAKNYDLPWGPKALVGV